MHCIELDRTQSHGTIICKGVIRYRRPCIEGGIEGFLMLWSHIFYIPISNHTSAMRSHLLKVTFSHLKVRNPTETIVDKLMQNNENEVYKGYSIVRV